MQKESTLMSAIFGPFILRGVTIRARQWDKIGQNQIFWMVNCLTIRHNQRKASGLHKQSMSNVTSGNTKLRSCYRQALVCVCATKTCEGIMYSAIMQSSVITWKLHVIRIKPSARLPTFCNYARCQRVWKDNQHRAPSLPTPHPTPRSWINGLDPSLSPSVVTRMTWRTNSTQQRLPQ